MTTKLEPKGKLDTAGAAVTVANGPEDALDWDAVDWRSCERQVQRLRQRIFTASQVGDLKTVRNLQKLMLRSRSNTLLAGSAGHGGQRGTFDGGRGRPGHPGRPRQGR